MAPSLVTWPIRNTGVPLFLAISMSFMVDSRTWEILPGAEVNSGLNMVWMESITMTFGRTDSTISRIDSISFSETTIKSEDTVDNL